MLFQYASKQAMEAGEPLRLGAIDLDLDDKAGCPKLEETLRRIYGSPAKEQVKEEAAQGRRQLPLQLHHLVRREEPQRSRAKRPALGLRHRAGLRGD